MKRYGYLLLERARISRVTLPDATITLCPAENTEEVIRGWFDHNVEKGTGSDPLPAESDWQRQLDDYRAATRVDRLPDQEFFGRAEAAYRVTYPDDHVEESTFGTPEERIRRRFEAIVPPPPKRAPAPSDGPTYDEWRSDVGVESLRSWRGAVVSDGEHRALDIAPLTWDFGLPSEIVVEALNDLADAGWEVLHVSEDRAISNGDDPDTDAVVTRARYLLVRDDGA